MQQICHSSTDVPREQSQLRKHLHTYKYIRKHSADCQIIVCRYSTPEKKLLKTPRNSKEIHRVSKTPPSTQEQDSKSSKGKFSHEE